MLSINCVKRSPYYIKKNPFKDFNLECNLIFLITYSIKAWLDHSCAAYKGALKSYYFK